MGMKYLQIKDKKLRKKFQKFELKLKLNKFLHKNILFFLSLKKNLEKKNFLIYFYMYKKKKFFFLNRIVRRCLLTNRAKSLRPFKFSRIILREFFGFGIIPGYKKAVW